MTPVCPTFFILSVEVLSNRIRQNINIKGITFGKHYTEIKVAQLADDMTIDVQDVKSGRNVINVIENFERVSGIHLNTNKTNAIWLGKTSPSETIKNISWCDTYFVKSLGIYFSKNKFLSKNMNWSQERFIKIQQLLNSWERRNLTFKGKVLILKSQVVSKLIYTAQILSCPMEWIKAYEKLFYNLLWGNRAKFKKENMINTLQNGGMTMIDNSHAYTIYFVKSKMVV